MLMVALFEEEKNKPQNNSRSMSLKILYNYTVQYYAVVKRNERNNNHNSESIIQNVAPMSWENLRNIKSIKGIAEEFLQCESLIKC